jgi:purine-nucleoside/S-methyl-5'-thioadenosine phosphorylase / adenosine deaminase
MATALKRKPTRRRARFTAPAVAGKSWKTRRANGIEILQSRALEKFPWLVHGFSTRPGGVSTLGGKKVLNLGFANWDARENVLQNRKKLLAALGAENMRLAPLRQIHSDIIHIFDSAPAEASSGDASITRTPGLLLAVQTADCIPILLADPKRRVVAAIHSGWRGTLKRIAAKMIGRMQMEFGTRPADLIAVLGPGIGRCCYEVGPEVVKQFAGQFAEAREWFDGPYDQLATGEEQNPLPWLTMAPPGHEPPSPRVQLDLIAANRAILIDAGARPFNIFASELCTACRTDLLFSYRREGPRTGRLMAVIGILTG